jgi:hypothetical protein
VNNASLYYLLHTVSDKYISVNVKVKRYFDKEVYIKLRLCYPIEHMKRILTAFILSVAVLLFQTDTSFAKSSSYHSKSSTSKSSHSSKATVHSSSGTHHGGRHKAAGVNRDKKGKIARSVKAKDKFKKSHPCPSTGRTSGACPGYVIDHITPLKKGGADSSSNMQWQTKADAKAKDKWE